MNILKYSTFSKAAATIQNGLTIFIQYRDFICYDFV